MIAPNVLCGSWHGTIPRDRVVFYTPPGLEKYQAQAHAYRVMPEEELFVVQEVMLEIPPEDRPGRPISRVFCARCGEGINDQREVQINGQVLCRACAYGSYYSEVAQRKNGHATPAPWLVVTHEA